METRHAKRRRKASAEPHFSDKRSYLNTLPEDALIVVLRFLSFRPYLRNWKAHVSPRDALQVLQCSGSLAVAARKSFDTIHAHISCGQMQGRATKGLHLERISDLSMFYDLVAEQAPRLRTLTLDVGGSFEKMEGTQFEFCVNLRVLALGRLFGTNYLLPILATCGGALRELHLGGDKRLPAYVILVIAKHCRALETLIIEHDSFAAPTVSIWEAVGGTLRKLAIKFPRMRERYDDPQPQESATIIAEKCPNLTELELLSRCSWRKTIPLLRALGSQLRVLRVMSLGSCPPPDDLKVIIGACSAVTVYASVDKHVEETLDILGGRLRGLELQYDFPMSPHFGEIASRCDNVEEAVLGPCERSRDLLAAFFDKPKPRLQSLKISQCFSGSATSLFGLLARSVGKLESFMAVVEKAVDDQMVADFLSVNSNLRKLVLWHAVPVTESEEARERAEYCASHLLPSLAQLPSLQEVCLSYSHRMGHSQKIANACMLLRFRCIDIVVGDAHY